MQIIFPVASHYGVQEGCHSKVQDQLQTKARFWDREVRDQGTRRSQRSAERSGQEATCIYIIIKYYITIKLIELCRCKIHVAWWRGRQRYKVSIEDDSKISDNGRLNDGEEAISAVDRRISSFLDCSHNDDFCL